MKFGHFDDERKEYVIETPYTPLPWINYLGNEDFFGLISNTAGGYDFYKDAKMRRITRFRYNNVPQDNGGRMFYISVDNEKAWSPSFMPTKTPLDHYEARHGLGYSTFQGKKNDISALLTCFVPLGERAEIMMLTIKNSGDKTRSIRTVGAVEWCLWNAWDDFTNFQRNYSTGEVEIEDKAIYHKTEYRERRNHYAFFSVNEAVTGYDSDRASFLGRFNDWNTPSSIEEGKMKNSHASGWSPIAALENRFTLAPEEEKTLVFVLGYIENKDEEKWEKQGIINKTKAHEMQSRYQSKAAVEKKLEELAQDESDAPIITSGCPTIGLYAEKHLPDVLPYLAPILSPMQAHAALLRNGCATMSRITGSGCMVTTLAGAFCGALPSEPFHAAYAALVAMGVCGEIAEARRLQNGTGNATFRTDLIDAVFNLTEEQLTKGVRYEVYEG